jgi:hypothetical protein
VQLLLFFSETVVVALLPVRLLTNRYHFCVGSERLTPMPQNAMLVQIAVEAQAGAALGTKHARLLFAAKVTTGNSQGLALWG